MEFNKLLEACKGSGEYDTDCEKAVQHLFEALEHVAKARTWLWGKDQPYRIYDGENHDSDIVKLDKMIEAGYEAIDDAWRKAKEL